MFRWMRVSLRDYFLQKDVDEVLLLITNENIVSSIPAIFRNEDVENTAKMLLRSGVQYGDVYVIETPGYPSKFIAYLPTENYSAAQIKHGLYKLFQYHRSVVLPEQNFKWVKLLQWCADIAHQKPNTYLVKLL